jgi:hypothetical protein
VITRLTTWAESLGLPCDVSLSGDIAIFSPCRRYRYILTRQTGPGDRVLAATGLNPSTATAFVNDPTIRRGIGFAQAWGCGLYVMLNAYAYRATDPKMMWRARDIERLDIVGEHNDAAISLVLGHLGDEDTALAAWGTHARTERVRRLAELAEQARVSYVCLGTNKDGSPGHPLYRPAATARQRWELNDG